MRKLELEHLYLKTWVWQKDVPDGAQGPILEVYFKEFGACLQESFFKI